MPGNVEDRSQREAVRMEVETLQRYAATYNKESDTLTTEQIIF